MSDEGFRPGELVLKPRTGRGIPVGQIETTHQDAVDRSLDITALVWVRVAREAPAGRMDGGVPRQDGDPVPALLTEPDRFISDVAQGLCREVAVLRLKLLQTDDLRAGCLQPSEQNGQPAVDPVDVIGGDPHRGPVR